MSHDKIIALLTLAVFVLIALALWRDRSARQLQADKDRSAIEASGATARASAVADWNVRHPGVPYDEFAYAAEIRAEWLAAHPGEPYPGDPEP